MKIAGFQTKTEVRPLYEQRKNVILCELSERRDITTFYIQ